MGLLFRGKSSRRLFSSPRCHFRVWFRLKTETEDASGERESCIPRRLPVLPNSTLPCRRRGLTEQVTVASSLYTFSKIATRRASAIGSHRSTLHAAQRSGRDNTTSDVHCAVFRLIVDRSKQ